jgi:hypothetical protein
MTDEQAERLIAVLERIANQDEAKLQAVITERLIAFHAGLVERKEISQSEPASPVSISVN